MSKNKTRIRHQLKKARGFGHLDIIQRLPKKRRRRCDELDLQVKAVRGVMKTERIEMQEEFVLLLLTDEQELIAGLSMYVGTDDEVGFDYRDIIRAAALANAYYIIIAHNHPSGFVQPSNADLDSASRLAHAVRFAGFELLDSLVVTRKKHFSLAQNGLIRL